MCKTKRSRFESQNSRGRICRHAAGPAAAPRRGLKPVSTGHGPGAGVDSSRPDMCRYLALRFAAAGLMRGAAKRRGPAGYGIMTT